MDLTTIITGEVVTEKSERQKAAKTYTLKVRPEATKVEVIQALRRHYGVEPMSVRMLNIRPKRRAVARGKFLQKRNPSKRAIVTLGPKSKTLDLTTLSS